MRILLTGGSGQLGPYIVRRLQRDGLTPVVWSHQSTAPIFGICPRPVSLSSPEAIDAALRDSVPEVILHCAAISNIQEALSNPPRTVAVNVAATRQLAEFAARNGAHLIYLSTDLVFDGDKGHYSESDEPRPLSVYAKTKQEGEQHVAALTDSSGSGLVLRIPLVLGPSLNGKLKFFDQLIASLREGKTVTLFSDEWRTPIAPDVVAEALRLAITERLTGLFHLAGPQRLSRYEMGERIARLLGLDSSKLIAASRLSVASPEPRPRDTSLDASRWHARFPSFPRDPFDQGLKESMSAAN